MSYAIQVNDLKKSYGDNNVLKGISFDVNKGEIFALLGVNGAGKTTALECIENLQNCDSGSVVVSGKIGIQLQSSSLPAHIKVCEAVQLFAKWNKSLISQSMLASLGINEIAKKQYSSMSTGQKRRLHLALSLISNPDIVFLDEPTAGLDVEGRISFHGEIRKLKSQGKTVIMASHDMAEVEALCDRIAILRDGKIVFLGTVSELTKKIGRYVKITVKTSQGEDMFESQNVGDTLFTQLEKYKMKGLDVLDVKIDRGSLEEHFIRLSKGE